MKRDFNDILNEYASTGSRKLLNERAANLVNALMTSKYKEVPHKYSELELKAGGDPPTEIRKDIIDVSNNVGSNKEIVYNIPVEKLAKALFSRFQRRTAEEVNNFILDVKQATKEIISKMDGAKKNPPAAKKEEVKSTSNTSNKGANNKRAWEFEDAIQSFFGFYAPGKKTSLVDARINKNIMKAGFHVSQGTAVQIKTVNYGKEVSFGSINPDKFENVFTVIGVFPSGSKEVSKVYAGLLSGLFWRQLSFRNDNEIKSKMDQAKIAAKGTDEEWERFLKEFKELTNKSSNKDLTSIRFKRSRSSGTFRIQAAMSYKNFMRQIEVGTFKDITKEVKEEFPSIVGTVREEETPNG